MVQLFLFLVTNYLLIYICKDKDICCLLKRANMYSRSCTCYRPCYSSDYFFQRSYSRYFTLSYLLPVIFIEASRGGCWLHYSVLQAKHVSFSVVFLQFWLAYILIMYLVCWLLFYMMFAYFICWCCFVELDWSTNEYCICPHVHDAAKWVLSNVLFKSPF